jgi:hypothetical protein
LLDAAEQSIRQSSETASELAVDHHLSAVATLTCNRTINSARDLAWSNARLLWAVRNDPLARGLFLDSLAASLDSLAASTALASRMLLWRSETAPAGALLVNRGFWRRPFPETDDLSPISRYLVSD